MSKLLLPLKEIVYTITSDNGKEFAMHEETAKIPETDFYFAHPYASYERGLNENTNGLIRQYFPKDRDFRTITDEEIMTAMKKLNNRPRKALGFLTPNEVFFRYQASLNLPMALIHSLYSGQLLTPVLKNGQKILFFLNIIVNFTLINYDNMSKLDN